MCRYGNWCTERFTDSSKIAVSKECNETSKSRLACLGAFLLNQGCATRRLVSRGCFLPVLPVPVPPSPLPPVLCGWTPPNSSSTLSPCSGGYFFADESCSPLLWNTYLQSSPWSNSLSLARTGMSCFLKYQKWWGPARWPDPGMDFAWSITSRNQANILEHYFQESSKHLKICWPFVLIYTFCMACLADHPCPHAMPLLKRKCEHQREQARLAL